jgi:dienelactone hydrolase
LAASSTFASGHPADAKFAGVVAYYPYCVDDMKHGSTTPTLLLVGEKDDFAPARLCEVGKGAPNLEFVFYPGATHYFEMPGVGDFQGHHMAYDAKAAKEAEARVDAFIAAHTTEVRTQ